VSDTDSRVRVCPRCNEARPDDHFNKHRRECKTCRATAQRAYVARNREAVYERSREWRTSDRNQKRSHLRRLYGVSLERYDEMLTTQGGVCAICEQTCPTGRYLAVDHDHDTGLVRGLLCSKCNPGLGWFNDDPARLRAAADYLESTRA
jgi:hypothetical protein